MSLRFSRPHKLMLVSFVFILTSCAQQIHTESRLAQTRAALIKSHQQSIPNQAEGSSQQSLELEALYHQALTPRTATQIFIAQSPRVRELLSQLNQADAQELQASLIGNPHLSFSLLKSNDAGHWLWDASLLQPFFDLFSRNARQKVAAQEAEQIELEVLDQLHQLIAEFQVDYFKALNAQQALLIAKNQLEASDARASLAQAIYAAGNISELEYLDHLVEFQKEQLNFSNLSLEQEMANKRLNYWFASDKSFQLSKEFPEIPTKLWDANLLKKIAHEQNPSLQSLGLQQLQFEEKIKLVKKEYGISNLDFGIAAKQEADGSKAFGVAADIPLGLFDQGKAKVMMLIAKSNANHAKQKEAELKLGYDIDLALLRMQIAQTNIRSLDQAKTTAERRLALAQQQMNFMLKNPFELIELKYQLLNVYQTVTKEQLNYWQAYSELEAKLGRSLAIDDAPGTTNVEIKK